MASFVARGTVPSFKHDEFRLPVDNDKEMIKFWRDERIDTKYTLLREGPTVKVSGALALRCKPGDRVAVTVEPFDRVDGRRVRTVGVNVLSSGRR